MDLNKPFRRYSFYLDLQNSPQVLNQLTQYINALGGKIDEFLNRNVKYIVTNRPKNVWPQRESIINSNNNKFGLHLETYQSINSPIAKNNSNKNSDLFSRGKLLLSKIETDQKLVPNVSISSSKKTQTTDVLELGRIWNIKIIQAIDMLEFCKKHLSPTLPNSPPIATQITQLRSPFIKIEDNLLKHRPNYKEFYEWPVVNYDMHPDLCPFIKKKVQKNTVDGTQSLEGLAFANKFNDKLTNHLNDDKSKETKNQTLNKKKVANKRRIPYYCEICQTEYSDLSKHLKTEVHENYTQNEENYRELRSVISSLPRFNESNNIVKCMQFDDESDLSESEIESCSPCSPFQSTPNMSTKIQLSGSKHKSHFMPITDLIANNNNNNNNKSSQECESNDNDIQTNQDSSNAFDFIPPSVSSVNKNIINKNKTRITYIYDSCLDHISDESSNYEESEEYIILNEAHN